MSSLQSYLAGRVAEGGLGQLGSLQTSMTLTSFASLGTVETFREGLFASLRSSMVGGRNDGVFRLGAEELPAKNAGPTGDTVPGGVGTSFVLTVGGATQQGFVNTVGDDDWYRVTLTAGQTYIFTLNGSGATPLQDPYLELYNSSGGLIAFDDDFGPGINAMLRFTVTESGTYYINARGFEAEGVSNTGGYTLAAVTGPPPSPLDSIDYHFTMPGPDIAIWFAPQGFTNPAGDTSIRGWTQQEIAAVFAALDTYEAILPLTFSLAASQASADWVLSLITTEDNVLAYFGPGTIGYGAFNPNVANWTAGLVPGGDSWATLIHEFGHGLGLAHPHDNGSANYGVNNSEIMQGVTGPFNSYGTFLMNQGVFTTMSYNDGWPLGGLPDASALTGAQATPMALDVALLQQRYGANMNTGLGNTVYTIATTSSSYRAIWDVSGTDAIVYNGSGNATIDLRAATLQNALGGGGFVSFATGAAGGFTIANGVVIENATGGSGNDTLTGNSAANVLTGNFGDDTLNGGLGNDTLNGGAGFDVLSGDAGDDTIFWDAADNPGGVQGGAGADILVFTSGPAPTGFDLVAHGFESAENRLTDPGGNPWTTQTSFYDSAWRIDLSVVVNDDGSRAELDYDQLNAFDFATNFNQFDPAGGLDINVTVYDTGITAAYDFDQTNSFDWVSNWNQYLVGGALDINVTVYDSGITASNDFDPEDAFDWTSNWIQYDASGDLDINVTVFDDGVTASNDFDQDHLFDWTSNWSRYDSLDRLDLNVVVYDNGNTAVLDYDQANEFTWATRWQLFDPAGNLIGFQQVNDDGSIFGP